MKNVTPLAILMALVVQVYGQTNTNPVVKNVQHTNGVVVTPGFWTANSNSILQIVNWNTLPDKPSWLTNAWLTNPIPPTNLPEWASTSAETTKTNLGLGSTNQVSFSALRLSTTNPFDIGGVGGVLEVLSESNLHGIISEVSSPLGGVAFYGKSSSGAPVAKFFQETNFNSPALTVYRGAGDYGNTASILISASSTNTNARALTVKNGTNETFWINLDGTTSIQGPSASVVGFTNYGGTNLPANSTNLMYAHGWINLSGGSNYSEDYPNVGNGGTIDLSGFAPVYASTDSGRGGKIEMKGGPNDPTGPIAWGDGGKILANYNGGTINVSTNGGSFLATGADSASGGTVNVSGYDYASGGGSFLARGSAGASGGTVDVSGVGNWDGGGQGGRILARGGSGTGNAGTVDVSASVGNGGSFLSLGSTNFDGGSGGQVDVSSYGQGINGGNIYGRVYGQSGSGGLIDFSRYGSGDGIGGTLNISGDGDGNGGQIIAVGNSSAGDGGTLNLSAGGYSGHGGNILATGAQEASGGTVDVSAKWYSPGGQILARGGDGAGSIPGGTVNVSAGSEGAGGQILAVGGGNGNSGGTVNVSGGGDSAGGNLLSIGGVEVETSPGVWEDTPGGTLNLSYGGGDIITANRGGSINTFSGFIELGTNAGRTTIQKTITNGTNVVYLPTNTGTIALTNSLGSWATTTNAETAKASLGLGETNSPTFASLTIGANDFILDPGGVSMSGSYVIKFDARVLWNVENDVVALDWTGDAVTVHMPLILSSLTNSGTTNIVAVSSNGTLFLTNAGGGNTFNNVRITNSGSLTNLALSIGATNTGLFYVAGPPRLLAAVDGVQVLSAGTNSLEVTAPFLTVVSNTMFPLLSSGSVRVATIGTNGLLGASSGIPSGASPTTHALRPDGASNSVFAYALGMPDGAFYIGTAPSTVALGTNAINIQTTRTNATNVASGLNAIAIGASSRASAQDSVAVGRSALATTVNSTVLGSGAFVTGGAATAVGMGANATANDSVVIGAGANANGGHNAHVIGYQASATGFRSLAVGNQALSSATNAAAIGANLIADLHSQFMTHPFRSVFWGGTTTNTATNTEIFLGAAGSGSAQTRLVLPTNSALIADLWIIASSTNRTLSARRTVAIRRDTTTNTSLIGAVQTNGTDQTFGGPSWTITVDADDTNEALRVQVAGATNDTVTWRVSAFYRTSP